MCFALFFLLDPFLSFAAFALFFSRFQTDLILGESLTEDREERKEMFKQAVDL
jgi:hypothetical protein